MPSRGCATSFNVSQTPRSHPRPPLLTKTPPPLPRNPRFISEKPPPALSLRVPLPHPAAGAARAADANEPEADRLRPAASGPSPGRSGPRASVGAGAAGDQERAAAADGLPQEGRHPAVEGEGTRCVSLVVQGGGGSFERTISLPRSVFLKRPDLHPPARRCTVGFTVNCGRATANCRPSTVNCHRFTANFLGVTCQRSSTGNIGGGCFFFCFVPCSSGSCGEVPRGSSSDLSEGAETTRFGCPRQSVALVAMALGNGRRSQRCCPAAVSNAPPPPSQNKEGLKSKGGVGGHLPCFTETVDRFVFGDFRKKRSSVTRVCAAFPE